MLNPVRDTIDYPILGLGAWCALHPTSAKVAALVIGAGLLASLPYSAPFLTGVAIAGVTVLGVSLISASLLSMAVPLWGSENKSKALAAKVFTLAAGIMIACSPPVLGATALLGVSIPLIGGVISAVSGAAILCPPFGRGVAHLSSAVPYAIGAACLSYVAFRSFI